MLRFTHTIKIVLRGTLELDSQIKVDTNPSYFTVLISPEHNVMTSYTHYIIMTSHNIL